MTKEQLEQRLKDEQRRAENKKKREQESAKTVKQRNVLRNQSPFSTKTDEESSDFDVMSVQMDPITAYFITEFNNGLDKIHRMVDSAMELVELSQTVIDEQRALIEDYKQLLNAKRG